MNIRELFDLLWKIAQDEDIRNAVLKLLDWIFGLEDQAREAYLSKFVSVSGYGTPVGDCPCPDCPDDCKPGEEALLAHVKAS